MFKMLKSINSNPNLNPIKKLNNCIYLATRKAHHMMTSKEFRFVGLPVEPQSTIIAGDEVFHFQLLDRGS